MTQGMIRAPGAGVVARQGFGEQSIEQRAETATAAAQEEARALVQAKCILALQRPRDWAEVRKRILADCARPRFAEEAKYLKPIGDGIEGPSVRFAEACARHAGNLWRTARVTFEDQIRRHVQLSVMDLETNLTLDEEIVIEKTVERRYADDRHVLGQRKNKKGDTVFIVAATDDEILNKANALKKKAERTLLLAFVPADIVEEAMEAVEATKEGMAKLAGARERMVAEFAKVRVTVADLEAWLGHPLAQVSPREMSELRNVYSAMADGEGSWADHLESRRARRAQQSNAPAPPPQSTPAAQPPAGAVTVAGAPEASPPSPAPAPAPEPKAEAGPPADAGGSPPQPPRAVGGPTDAAMTPEEQAQALLLERIEACETPAQLNKLARQVHEANNPEVRAAYDKRKREIGGRP